MQNILSALIVTVALAAACGERAAGEEGWTDPAVIDANGVQLHYVERGEGPAIIFVHGGLADYREWTPVADDFDGYRRILYSRRYNWPNENPLTTQKHSARIEAADLAALIDNLKLGPVHLVGVSYGGYTAFVLALKHPELVRTLTLAEPALAGWLPAITQGGDIYRDFRTRMWEPSAEAARAGDIETSISIALDYLAFDGAWSAFSPEVQAEILKNGREWEALTRSADAFPDKAPVAAESLQMPLLVISGGNSLAMHKLIDAEIVERQPQAQRVIIEGATHQMCSEKPAICKDAVRSMLEQYGG